jgi:hypothetical protein
VFVAGDAHLRFTNNGPRLSVQDGAIQGISSALLGKAAQAMSLEHCRLEFVNFKGAAGYRVVSLSVG